MRTFCRRLVLAAGAAALWLPGNAYAWGPDGHEWIATAARDRLVAADPALGGKFYEIFKGNALFFRGHDKKNNRPMTCSGRTLREIASWPDCIRRTKEYARTGAFHFDDIPICADMTPPPPRSSYCNDEKCASGQLAAYVAKVKSANTRFDRAAALAWIIHIVGDLHQPLHTEDNGDSGGNGVKVKLVRGTIPGSSFTAGKFHGFWDTPMVIAAVGRGPSAVAAVETFIDAHAGDSGWNATDPNVWAAESHAIAVDAYHELANPPACNVGATDGGTIDAAYVAKFTDPVKERLARGAYRLTAVLRDALS